MAPTDVPVLITGESGTGKELVARAIHRHSARKNGPFLPVCLAALSPGVVERELFGHLKGSFTGALQDRKGLFELAGGGSVLLDEIGDVSPSLQVKLLRAIEHGEVTPVGDARPRPIDIRVIAATNRPLHALLASGEFREDLFYRLSVFQIEVPPLCDRREDIPALAEHFFRRARPGNASLAPLGDDVLHELCRRPWTGNVRELRNAIEYAAIVARGDRIRKEHLPAASRAGRDRAPLGPSRDPEPVSSMDKTSIASAWPRAVAAALRTISRARRAASASRPCRGMRAQPRRSRSGPGDTPGYLARQIEEIRHRLASAALASG